MVSIYNCTTKLAAVKSKGLSANKTIHLTILSQKQSRSARIEADVCLAREYMCVPADVCRQAQRMRKAPLLATMLQSRQSVLCSLTLLTEHDGTDNTTDRQ